MQFSQQYLDWNLKKELVPRENSYREVSPWALIWQLENYYLAAYDSVDARMKHYRVDKMGKVTVLDSTREGLEQFEQTDPATYTNRTFSMYGGVEETVTLQFPNNLIGVVMDRFGKDTDIRPMPDGCFRMRAQIAISNQFFGWLAGIGPDAKIISPKHVEQEYYTRLREILNVSKSND